jgi:hypothetical protein
MKGLAEERHVMSSDRLAVHGEYTLRGHRRATVHVHRAGVAWDRGTLEGTLLIERGGTAHVFVAVLGNIHNGGRLVLRGVVRGGIHTVADGRVLDFRRPDRSSVGDE